MIYLKSPNKQWQTREQSQLLHARSQAVACPLAHIWEFKQTRLQESFAERLQGDMLHLKFWDDACPD